MALRNQKSFNCDSPINLIKGAIVFPTFGIVLAYLHCTWMKKNFFLAFFATTWDDKGLLLALYSGITPGGALGCQGSNPVRLCARQRHSPLHYGSGLSHLFYNSFPEARWAVCQVSAPHTRCSSTSNFLIILGNNIIHPLSKFYFHENKFASN